MICPVQLNICCSHAFRIRKRADEGADHFSRRITRQTTDELPTWTAAERSMPST